MKKIIIENNDYKTSLSSRGFFDVVILDFPVFIEDVVNPFNSRFENKQVVEKIKDIVNESSKIIKDNGVLFIYGSPVQLTYAYNALLESLKFRYWISLDMLDAIEKDNYSNLKHNHLGILMLTKGDKYINLNLSNTRTPYIACSSCGKNTKDWGGKKHLMNVGGIGLSDVWKDMYKIQGEVSNPERGDIKLSKVDINKLENNFNKNIPQKAFERLIKLVKGNDDILHIKVVDSWLKKINNYKKIKQDKKLAAPVKGLENKVVLGDAVQVMKKWLKEYPEGIFSLTFADPPYNLLKKYEAYSDDLASEEYIKWCDEWLELCAKLTKPNGTVMILNIPKWALEHSRVLNENLYLQNWIVWDALSTPKGKIMPAHYSLLYYTKSPTNYIYNHAEGIDSPEYCSRVSCSREREKSGDSKKIAVSDIWWDVYRIKHKKDRDNHPCQLPEKLMDRIVKMFSNEGDLVFDPFAGAGTTAIAALRNKRKYLTIEIDPYYKQITESKLNQISQYGDYERKVSSKKSKSLYTKKELEIKVQDFSVKLGRKPNYEEFITKYSLNEGEIKKLYEVPSDVLKAGRISLLNK